jgi:hypothetical protein
MQVVAFIEPPQADVLEKILRHCGLWRASSPRGPPVEDGWVHDPDGDADCHSASDERAGTDVHGRSHVLGDVLVFPDLHRPKAGTRVLRRSAFASPDLPADYAGNASFRPDRGCR